MMSLPFILETYHGMLNKVVAHGEGHSLLSASGSLDGWSVLHRQEKKISYQTQNSFALEGTLAHELAGN
jgi:hypothetical protein